jgi:hypothetical protein
MRNSNVFKQFEKAQIIPIVVVALIVLIAFAALLIDGGSIMLNRRTAQAAADAGAMAGARELCVTSGANPLEVAENYAFMNGAATADAQLESGIINITTTVVNDSFFAKIFGVDSLQGYAEAAAGCFAPAGNYLLPVAWSCRPSLSTTPPFDPGVDCKMMALDWTGLLEPLVERETPSIGIPGNDGDYEMEGNNIVHIFTRKPPKQIYIIMDKISSSTETYCKEDLQVTDPGYAAAITCDIDGDGKNDIEGGGNRGWLDLNNGGGGASDMRSWIINGLNFPIYPHTWLSGQTGTVTNVYEAVKNYRVGQVVLIPIFNAICNSAYPKTNAACMEVAHASPFPLEPTTGDIDKTGTAPKFHIVAFDPFYISCVHTFSSDYCPGFALAQKMNPDPSNPSKSLIPDNTPAIEGFFLKNIEMPLDVKNNCIINMANCLGSLIK